MGGLTVLEDDEGAVSFVTNASALRWISRLPTTLGRERMGGWSAAWLDGAGEDTSAVETSVFMRRWSTRMRSLFSSSLNLVVRSGTTVL